MRVKDDAMNRHVPNLVIVVEVVDLTPSSFEAMVSFPHIKHLANKYAKVEIYGELGLKVVVGRPPEAVLRIRDVVVDV